jgi:hypothetical protein
LGAPSIRGPSPEMKERYQSGIGQEGKFQNRLLRRAIFFNGVHNPDLSSEFYEETLAVDREVGDRRAEGNSLRNVSMAFAKLNDRQQAIENTAAAPKIYEQIEDPRASQVRS